MTSRTSSGRSPRPSIRPDLVGVPGAIVLGMGQHVERALVARAQADLAVEARHGLGVVIEDVGRGFHDDLDGRVAALEIGHQDFDAAAGNAPPDGADDQGEQLRAAVLAVVAIDAGDDGELRAPWLRRLRRRARARRNRRAAGRPSARRRIRSAGCRRCPGS